MGGVTFALVESIATLIQIVDLALTFFLLVRVLAEAVLYCTSQGMTRRIRLYVFLNPHLVPPMMIMVSNSIAIKQFVTQVIWASVRSYGKTRQK